MPLQADSSTRGWAGKSLTNVKLSWEHKSAERRKNMCADVLVLNLRQSESRAETYALISKLQLNSVKKPGCNRRMCDENVHTSHTLHTRWAHIFLEKAAGETTSHTWNIKRDALSLLRQVSPLGSYLARPGAKYINHVLSGKVFWQVSRCLTTHRGRDRLLVHIFNTLHAVFSGWLLWINTCSLKTITKFRQWCASC